MKITESQLRKIVREEIMSQMNTYVVYSPLGQTYRHVWKGQARNAHHAQAQAEEATGKNVGEAIMVLPHELSSV